MATARKTARWQHYEQILARAGIGPAERDSILLADAIERAQRQREAEQEIREAMLRETVRP
jgi:hypothetical protein